MGIFGFLKWGTFGLDLRASIFHGNSHNLIQPDEALKGIEPESSYEIHKGKLIMAHTAKFRIGIFLLVANQPLGFLAILVCNAIALRQHNAIFSFIGLGAYVLSWGMLGLGLLLAGPEGIAFSRSLLKKIRGFFSNFIAKSRRLFTSFLRLP